MFTLCYTYLHLHITNTYQTVKEIKSQSETLLFLFYFFFSILHLSVHANILYRQKLSIIDYIIISLLFDFIYIKLSLHDYEFKFT